MGCEDSSPDLLAPLSNIPQDLAAIKFATEGKPTAPYMMLELRRPQGFNGFVAINGSGQVVWYFRTQGTSSSYSRRANGNFVFLDGDRGLLEVNAAGQVVRQLAQQAHPGRRIHHDATVTPRNTVLFIAEDTRTIDGRPITGEALWEWDPEVGTTVRRWSSFNELDPKLDWGTLSHDEDWLHANSVSMGPRGNVILSFHYLNQVISIAPDFSRTEWRLGGVRGNISVDEQFTGQHTAQSLADGRVLLFDNGYERTTTRYSRAVEFQIEGSLARKIWEWRPPHDNWARILSSVRRLPNGNSVISFGTSQGFVEGATGPIEAYEVKPDGFVAWHLIVGGEISSMYRATPIQSF